MSDQKGTPQSLDEAIARALCVGPLSEIKERAYWILRDYLSQGFGAFMLQEKDEKTEELLKALFEHVTRRSK